MSDRRSFVPRATRYRITIAVRYRKTGEAAWREGRSENISRTGLLFRAERMLPAQTPIEMMLEMPAEVSAASGVHVRRGRIVRAAPASPHENQPAYAAAAFELDYTHPDDPRRI
jgi:hypothetical protein